MVEMPEGFLNLFLDIMLAQDLTLNDCSITFYICRQFKIFKWNDNMIKSSL